MTKNISRLTPVKVTDKRGRTFTVYKRTGEAPKTSRESPKSSESPRMSLQKRIEQKVEGIYNSKLKRIFGDNFDFKLDFNKIGKLVYYLPNTEPKKVAQVQYTIPLKINDKYTARLSFWYSGKDRATLDILKPTALHISFPSHESTDILDELYKDKENWKKYRDVVNTSWDITNPDDMLLRPIKEFFTNYLGRK